MKHISIAMSNLNMDQEVNNEHISLLEQILRETKNPKIAAVLALDLMLVGVDTVSIIAIHNFSHSFHICVIRSMLFYAHCLK
jgi:cytochrome P450 family 49 subfamily A